MHPSTSPLRSTRSSFLYADPSTNALRDLLPSTVPASSHLFALPNSVAPPINPPNEEGTFLPLPFLASSTPVCVCSHNLGEPTDPANRCPASDLDLGRPGAGCSLQPRRDVGDADKRPVQVDVAQNYHRSGNYRVSYVPFLPDWRFPCPYCWASLYLSLIYEGIVVLVVNLSLKLSSSVPFFFEPNFTACVATLAAALRIQAQSLSNGDGGRDGEYVDTSAYPPVVYGDFLDQKESRGQLSRRGNS